MLEHKLLTKDKICNSWRGEVFLKGSGFAGTREWDTLIRRQYFWILLSRFPLVQRTAPRPRKWYSPTPGSYISCLCFLPSFLFFPKLPAHTVFSRKKIDGYFNFSYFKASSHILAVSCSLHFFFESEKSGSYREKKYLGKIKIISSLKSIDRFFQLFQTSVTLDRKEIDKTVRITLMDLLKIYRFYSEVFWRISLCFEVTEVSKNWTDQYFWDLLVPLLFIVETQENLGCRTLSQL